MELERQVQLGIVEAALGIVNDPTESKATRRKHRLAYQQSQRRLQELETELNFLRQSRGKTHRQTSQLPTHAASYNAQSHSHVNVKHRTKKPRPPLDSTGICSRTLIVYIDKLTNDFKINLILIYVTRVLFYF